MSRYYYYSRTTSYPKQSFKKKFGWLWVLAILLGVIIYFFTTTNLDRNNGPYPYKIEIDVTDKINDQ